VPEAQVVDALSVGLNRPYVAAELSLRKTTPNLHCEHSPLNGAAGPQFQKAATSMAMSPDWARPAATMHAVSMGPRGCCPSARRQRSSHPHQQDLCRLLQLCQLAFEDGSNSSGWLQRQDDKHPPPPCGEIGIRIRARSTIDIAVAGYRDRRPYTRYRQLAATAIGERTPTHGRTPQHAVLCIHATIRSGTLGHSCTGSRAAMIANRSTSDTVRAVSAIRPSGGGVDLIDGPGLDLCEEPPAIARS